MVNEERLDELLRSGQDGKMNLYTVRDLLLAFGYRRRGYWVNKEIQEHLTSKGWDTSPDFATAYIDGPISFIRASASTPEIDLCDDGADTLANTVATVDVAGYVSGPKGDATYRIGRLAPANRPPQYVSPNDAISKAVTLMLQFDFSQLPVMTSDREVKGVISWRSISKHFVLSGQATEVREAMDRAYEVSGDISLFEALGLIAKQGYVLVRDPSNRAVQGIVTSSDLADQFKELAEPFLLLGEIENHIRQILDGKFTEEVLRDARDPADADRPISTVADLTFGEYVRHMEKPASWEKCKLAIDRATFVQSLKSINAIRNDVMHFDPDPMTAENKELLSNTAVFLRELERSNLF